MSAHHAFISTDTNNSYVQPLSGNDSDALVQPSARPILPRPTTYVITTDPNQEVVFPVDSGSNPRPMRTPAARGFYPAGRTSQATTLPLSQMASTNVSVEAGQPSGICAVVCSGDPSSDEDKAGEQMERTHANHSPPGKRGRKKVTVTLSSKKRRGRPRGSKNKKRVPVNP